MFFYDFLIPLEDRTMICLQIIVPKTFIIEQIIKKINRLQLHHEFTIKPIKTNKSKKNIIII